MKVGKLMTVLWTAALLVGSADGCKCGKDQGEKPSGPLDTPPIAVSNPQASAPDIVFPARWRSRDAAMNSFIESTLKVAAQGDYDGFRQLFGMANMPPSRQEFQRIWEAVEAITVAGVYGDGPEPEKYFLHALVKRRQPDRKGRLTLNVVVTVFQEAGQWRLGPAPKEVVDLILESASRPASGPTSGPAP